MLFGNGFGQQLSQLGWEVHIFDFLGQVCLENEACEVGHSGRQCRWAHCESGNGSGWLKLDGNEAVRCSTL